MFFKPFNALSFQGRRTSRTGPEHLVQYTTDQVVPLVPDVLPNTVLHHGPLEAAITFLC